MRRRKDPFDKPWVVIAAVIGVIAVVVIALVSNWTATRYGSAAG